MVLPSIIHPEKHPAVQLKTILNFVEPYKSFVYKKARWADSETKTKIEILIKTPSLQPHFLGLMTH